MKSFAPISRPTYSSAVAKGAAALLFSCAIPVASAASVYIALGDSITFGETDLNYVGSFGDRGYVAGYADTLAARNGGVRPAVFNLAIDGETAASFMSGAGRTPPVVGRTDTPLALQNLNYQSGNLVPQGQLFASTVAAQAAAGNTIEAITITLGFNELASLSALPTDQALIAIAQTLASYQANYSAVLNQVRALAPSANLSLLGYFNPFLANPSSPAAPIFNAAGVQLNGIIKILAATYGASFVDTAGPFVGSEAAYTFLDEMPAGSVVGGLFGGVLPIGNVHPNAAGYAVIAGQVAAVPEPGTWALMAAGLLFVACCRRAVPRLAGRSRRGLPAIDGLRSN